MEKKEDNEWRRKTTNGEEGMRIMTTTMKIVKLK